MYKSLLYQSYKSYSLSYASTTNTSPLLYKTIGKQLRDITEKYPDKIAIIARHQKIKLTYQELLEKSEKIAAGFIKLGLKKGDRIGIYSPNNSEWVITQFAAALSDLILVNINPAYQINELKYALNKVL